MNGRVSLARKNLFQDRRRALLAVMGVGVALLLVLVLDGIFAGAMRQVTAYMKESPADAFVSQQGVRTMHMSTSALPTETVEAARKVKEVAWAEGLHYTTGIIGVGEERRLTYVLGYDTATGRGGPRRIAVGRAPGPGQILVDKIAADELGVGVEDTVTVLGRPFRISGLSRNGTNIINTTVFIRSDDFARLRGPTVAYVIVGARAGISPEQLARRLGSALPRTTVQTRAEFATQEGRIIQDMAADVMNIMSAIGFLIALAVVALTLFGSTLGKLREYGVVKALGAGPGRLAATVAAQAVWSIALGLAVAVVLALVVGAVISGLATNVLVVVEPKSIIRTGAAAVVIGGAAAVIPLRRVMRVDPATAFRRL